MVVSFAFTGGRSSLVPKRFHADSCLAGSRLLRFPLRRQSSPGPGVALHVPLLGAISGCLRPAVSVIVSDSHRSLGARCSFHLKTRSTGETPTGTLRGREVHAAEVQHRVPVPASRRPSSCFPVVLRSFCVVESPAAPLGVDRCPSLGHVAAVRWAPLSALAIAVAEAEAPGPAWWCTRRWVPGTRP